MTLNYTKVIDFCLKASFSPESDPDNGGKAPGGEKGKSPKKDALSW